jgi:hypothetical protein
MKFSIILDVMPCSLVYSYRRSGGTCQTHTDVDLIKEASSSPKDSDIHISRLCIRIMNDITEINAKYPLAVMYY